MSKLDELVKLDAEFDEKFGIYSNYADFCPDKEEYKSFARRYYSLGKLEEREAMKKVELIIRQKLVASIASEKTQEALKIVADLLNELNKN